jgi:hypothetical protein
MTIQELLNNLDGLVGIQVTPWCLSEVETDVDDGGVFWDDEFGERLGDFEYRSQAMLAVALRNAYPTLRAEIKRLQAEVDRNRLSQQETLDTAMRFMRMAFCEMMHENGMFGIKPTEYWINAIWQKDLAPKVRKYLFGNTKPSEV